VLLLEKSDRCIAHWEMLVLYCWFYTVRKKKQPRIAINANERKINATFYFNLHSSVSNFMHRNWTPSQFQMFCSALVYFCNLAVVFRLWLFLFLQILANKIRKSKPSKSNSADHRKLIWTTEYNNFSNVFFLVVNWKLKCSYSLVPVIYSKLA
jgi:hypothetical protein